MKKSRYIILALALFLTQGVRGQISDTTAIDSLPSGSVMISETSGAGFPYHTVRVSGAQESDWTFCTDIFDALSGRVPGLMISHSSGASGGAKYFALRGGNSIGGNNQPLIVVDGIPFDNVQSFSGDPDQGTINLAGGVTYINRGQDLNPDDFASVNFLNAADATALYGMKASNGVLLIQTKRGEPVKTQDGHTVHFSWTTALSVDKVSRIPKIQEKYGQGESGQWLGPESGTGYSWGPRLDTCSYTQSGLSPQQDVDGDGHYDWDKNGLIVSMNDPAAIGAPAEVYENINELIRTAYSFVNNLTISGGSRKGGFYASFSNLQGEGIIAGDNHDRSSARIAGHTFLTRKFRISGAALYVNSNGHRVQQGDNLSGVFSGLLLSPVSFDNSNGYGDPLNTSDAFMFTTGPAAGYPRTSRGYGLYDNPYWSVNKNQFKDNTDRIFGNILLEYLPVDWMRFAYCFGADYYNDIRSAHYAIYSAAQPAGSFFEDHHNHILYHGDLTWNIRKEIAPYLLVDVVIGHNMNLMEQRQLFVMGYGLQAPDIYEFYNTDSLYAAETMNKKQGSALYGQLGISYKRMLFLTVSGREEWSSVMSGKYFLPAAQAGFIFTELPVLKKGRTLSYGDIRFSFTETVNDIMSYGRPIHAPGNIYPQGWLAGTVLPAGGDISYSAGSQFYAPGIKPEHIRIFEAGTTLRFFNGRLGIDMTYYYSYSRDLLLWVYVNDLLSKSMQFQNGGGMENKGIEVSCSFTPVVSKDHKFRWDWFVNFSQNENLITELPEGISSVVLGGINSVEVRAEVGRPYGSLFGYRWIRDGAGHIIINDDPSGAFYGYPMVSADKSYLGSVQPDWMMGVGSQLKLHRVKIAFLFDIRVGGVVWNGTRSVMTAMGTHADTETRGDAVVFEGVPGHLDSNGDILISGETNNIIVYPGEEWYTTYGGGLGGADEDFVEEADQVRLREVYLSYEFNPEWFSRSFFRGFELFFSGRNLFLWTPYSGVDPETNLYGANNVQGIDYFNLPGTRTYTFGLKVQL